MEQGSWLDYGMFLQSFMLAAREAGMESCAQAAFCSTTTASCPFWGPPMSRCWSVACRSAYADPDALVNSYRTERLDAAEFMTVLD